jgi:hypothetical protein
MKKSLLICAACLTVAGSLRADLTESFGPTGTPLTSGVETTLDLPQFNPNLGTLLGVTVEYGVSFSGISVILTNLDPTVQTGNASFSATGVSISSAASLGNIPSDLQSILIRAFDIYDESGGQTLAANHGGYTWAPGTEDAHDSALLTSNANLGGYEGTGTFGTTILENFSEGATIGGSGNEGEINTPNSTFYGSVSYDYMPVPEPANLAGFGLVVVGSRWLWRQRRQCAL